MAQASVPANSASAAAPTVAPAGSRPAAGTSDGDTGPVSRSRSVPPLPPLPFRAPVAVPGATGDPTVEAPAVRPAAAGTPAATSASSICMRSSIASELASLVVPKGASPVQPSAISWRQ